MAVHLAVEQDKNPHWPKVYCGSPGSVLFTRNPKEATCRDCQSMASIVNSKELQARLARADEVRRLERAVIEAAVALAQMNQHIDYREEYEAAEDAVVEAARQLLAARAHTTEK